MQDSICSTCKNFKCTCGDEPTRKFSLKEVPARTTQQPTQVSYAQDWVMRNRYTDPHLKNLDTDAQAISNVVERIATGDIKIPPSWKP
jgi:hypothetical protein